MHSGLCKFPVPPYSDNYTYSNYTIRLAQSQ
nr:MAG TPA: hypothetical protein [Caudoviricetes sp.]